MARRWSPPALPAPRPLRSCADTLKVHSLGGLEGGKSGAGYGDDSFLVIQPTSEVLLAHGAALRPTPDVVDPWVRMCAPIAQEVSSPGGARQR